jgi:hypothetical protein
MPPPLDLSWEVHISYGPIGVGTGSTNFHRNTASHHFLVATGSVLTNSVCEMKPSRTPRAVGGVGRFAVRVRFFFLVFERVDLRAAMQAPAF